MNSAYTLATGTLILALGSAPESLYRCFYSHLCLYL